MAAAAQTDLPLPATQRAVLRSLSQQVAAELIGRPAVWLRDNAHRVGRNPDSTYSGPALVAALLSDAPPAELADSDLERVLQVVESVDPPSGRFDHALAAIERVHEQHGNAGLAAVGHELLTFLRAWCARDRFVPRDPPAEEDYVAAAVDRAAELARDEHRVLTGKHAGNLLLVCGGCDKYRLGRKWHAPPMPAGYAAHDRNEMCPKCSKRAR